MDSYSDQQHAMLAWKAVNISVLPERATLRASESKAIEDRMLRVLGPFPCHHVHKMLNLEHQDVMSSLLSLGLTLEVITPFYLPIPLFGDRNVYFA